MVFIIIPIGALAGLLGPALNQIMTSRAPKNAQGELQGAIGSVQALSNIFGPLAMTQSFFYFTHSNAPFFFPGAAFALASIVCALSMIPLLRGLKTVPKIEEQPADPPGETVPPEAGPQAGKAPDAAPQTA
jgi:DHA1 family tetracycline resistance protein-like MFS transporter